MRIKTQILPLLCAVASFFALVACNKKEAAQTDLQSSTSTEELSASIDQHVKDIDARLSSFKKEQKQYHNPLQEAHHDITAFTAYYDGQKLAKLVSQGGEAGFEFATHLYFKDDVLIFSQNYGSYAFRAENDMLFSIEKYYFKDEKVFLALIKEIDPESEAQFASAVEVVKILDLQDKYWLDTLKSYSLERLKLAE